MQTEVSSPDRNLGRAALIFTLGLISSLFLTLALEEKGADKSLAIFALWAAMPLVAWFMSRAAKARNKNPWFYGVACLIPPMALLMFIKLVVIREQSGLQIQWWLLDEHGEGKSRKHAVDPACSVRKQS